MKTTRTLYFPAALVAIACLSGCGVEKDPSSTAGAKITEQLVNAEAIDRLAPGEALQVDLRQPVVYTIDYSARPIDFSRVQVITSAGAKVGVEEYFQSMQRSANPLASVFPTASLKLYGLGSAPEKTHAPGQAQQALTEDCSSDGCWCFYCRTKSGKIVDCTVIVSC
jgi:hypothetical protein